MKRTWPMFVALGVLVVFAITYVDVRTNADALFGTDALDKSVLDTPVGRELIVALVSPDREKRTSLAREIADMLDRDPGIAAVHAGPGAISDALLEWVWERRFRLAPPEPDDLTVTALSQHLVQARQSLTSAQGMVFGDRLLRDPTGSFARLVHRFADGIQGLSQHDGVWQSRDDRAALLFVTLADHAFETNEVNVLTDHIREQAANDDVDVYLLGPRVIAAEIGAETARESTRAALIAVGLLLVWLLWALRSVRALILAILPSACGFLAGCLSVQVLFGSVHVIALGFGGVLTGLALDYALHVLGHAGQARHEAHRLILLGAATTAIGFLAMLGSGVPALMQIGVFVSTGLPVAAVLSRTIPSSAAWIPNAPPLERLTWRMPYRPWIETALLTAGIAIVSIYSANGSQTLVDPPDSIAETIDRFDTMVALPSGRHAVVVEGADLFDLLVRESELKSVLDWAFGAGAIDRYDMALTFLPVSAASPELANYLPSVPDFREQVTRALSEIGMETSFATTQVEAYREALQAPAITHADLEAFPETRPLATRIERTSVGWREIVRLFDVTDVDALTVAVAESDIPGVRMVDFAGQVEGAMIELRRKVLLWFGIGSLVSFGVLLIGHADKRRAVVIARTTGAAVGLTALIMGVIAGPLGIFEIVALALVFGIGIDYGLFLNRKESPDLRVVHCRSVGLCAASTMIAFSIMAISPVKMLNEIGLTVLLGVLVTLVLHSSQTYRCRVPN